MKKILIVKTNSPDFNSRLQILQETLINDYYVIGVYDMNAGVPVFEYPINSEDELTLTMIESLLELAK